MFQQQELKEISVLIQSHIPIITIETNDEQHATDLVNQAAIELNKPLYTWNSVDGLTRVDIEPFNVEIQDEKPLQFLDRLHTLKQSSIYLLCDAHPYLENPQTVRRIKQLAMDYRKHGHTLVLVGHKIEPAPEFRNFVSSFHIRLPDAEVLEQIIRDEANHYSQLKGGIKVKTNSQTMQRLIRNLQGLDVVSSRKIVRKLIYNDGAITMDEIASVSEAKFKMMDMEGVLHYQHETAAFADIGGLSTLKTWLNQREQAFLRGQTSTGLESPKGILMVGVQGGGKSLAAKAVAGAWGIPLLRLDFGALYNKYHGETERNLRQALKLAEMMRPCVLWLDEIEKGISTQANDGGTSRRVLGTLLTWMAERTEGVFIAATANDISQLPPELIRKGRMDEIFFVDLPDSQSREEIFAIHLNKRKQQASQFNLEKLSKESKGYTGAEIEHAVIGAMYMGLAENRALQEQDIIEELNRTKPLSVVMRESLQNLRDWAEDRTVRAN